MSFKDKLLAAGLVSDDDVGRVELDADREANAAETKRLTLTDASTISEVATIFCHRLESATTFTQLQRLANDFGVAMQRDPVFVDRFGAQEVFRTGGPRSIAEIEQLETELQLTLPPSYRSCLREIGVPTILGAHGCGAFMSASQIIQHAPGFSSVENEVVGGSRRWERWRELFCADDDVTEVAVVPLGPDEADQWLLFRNTAVVGTGHVTRAQPASRDEESLIVFVWHDEHEVEPRFETSFFDVLKVEIDRCIDQLSHLR